MILKKTVFNFLLFFVISEDFARSVAADGMTKSISMTTEGQVFVLNANQTIQLECAFRAENFNQFTNLVVWKKRQRHEEMEMNFLGNMLPPFSSTKRFSSTHSSLASKFYFKLEITNLSQEDSGNYTCQAKDVDSLILGSITHYVFVRDPVHTVFITAENCTERNDPNIFNKLSSSTSSSSSSLTDQWSPLSPLHLSPGSLTFIEGRPSTLRCTSTGGYPPPQLFIRLADKDITPLFHLTNTVDFYGEKGLRLMVHQSQRWTPGWKFVAQDDGKEIRCSAIISGLISKIHASVVVNVLYGPKINCSQSSAFVNERNVFLKCHVTSKPDVTSLYWTIDSQGTSLKEGEVVSELWTTVTDLGKGNLEAQLFIKKATQSCFRKYEIITENVVGKTSKAVELIRKENKASEEEWKRHQREHFQSKHPSLHDQAGFPNHNHQISRRIPSRPPPAMNIDNHIDHHMEGYRLSIGVTLRSVLIHQYLLIEHCLLMSVALVCHIRGGGLFCPW